MKFQRNKVLLLSFGLLLVITGIGVAGRTHITKFYKTVSGLSDKERKARFHNGIRRAVSPITFPSRGQPLQATRQSVKSLAAFIENRSGYSLSEKSQNKLAQLTHLSNQGELRRLGWAEVAQALNKALRVRLNTLSDNEVNNMVRVMAGLGESNEPADYEKRQVRLRASIAGGPTMAQLLKGLNAARKDSIQNEALITLASRRITEEVESHYSPLADALPEQFGRGVGCDPIGATALIYSALADDLLATSNEDLVPLIRKVYKNHGVKDTDENVKKVKVFGSKSIICPVPLEIILDDQTFEVFFSELERSAKR